MSLYFVWIILFLGFIEEILDDIVKIIAVDFMNYIGPGDCALYTKYQHQDMINIENIYIQSLAKLLFWLEGQNKCQNTEISKLNIFKTSITEFYLHLVNSDTRAFVCFYKKKFWGLHEESREIW